MFQFLSDLCFLGYFLFSVFCFLGFLGCFNFYHDGLADGVEERVRFFREGGGWGWRFGFGYFEGGRGGIGLDGMGWDGMHVWDAG